MRALLAIIGLLLWAVPVRSLVTGSLVPSAAEARELVTVESIDVVGGSGLARDLIESALGVSAGSSLPREELDAHLAEAERRLTALGYYRVVDIRLTKGAARGRFHVVVRLEAKSAAYVGAGYLTRTGHDASIEQPNTKRDDRAEVFAGSRDWGSSGLRFELSASRDHSHTTAEGRDSETTSLTTQAIGLWPDIGGTPFFAWLMAQYLSGRQGSSERYGNAYYSYRYDSGGTNSSLFTYAAGGVRHGLSTLTLLAGRGRFAYDYHYQSTSSYAPTTNGGTYNLNESLTFLGGELAYTEKTGLAAVEPGTNARLTYSRTLAPGGHFLGPNYNAVLQHTLLFRDVQALTPTLLGVADWGSSLDSTPQRLVRTYEAGLIYEYVLPGNVIIGVERATVGVVDLHRPGYPGQRASLSLRYISQGLIASLTLTYGPEGLSYVQDDFNQSRLTPP